jgi:hypothetical protein
MKVILAERGLFRDNKEHYYYTKTGRTKKLKEAKKFLFELTAIIWLNHNYTKVENCFGFNNKQQVISVKEAKRLFGEEIKNEKRD